MRPDHGGRACARSGTLPGGRPASAACGHRDGVFECTELKRDQAARGHRHGCVMVFRSRRESRWLWCLGAALPKFACRLRRGRAKFRAERDGGLVRRAVAKPAISVGTHVFNQGCAIRAAASGAIPLPVHRDPPERS